MHRALTTRWLGRALRIGEASPSTSLPVFLCPSVSHSGRFAPRRIRHSPACQYYSSTTITSIYNEGSALAPVSTSAPPQTDSYLPTVIADKPVRKLPLTCSGCGAFSQTVDPQQLGYYNPERKRVKAWTHGIEPDPDGTKIKKEAAEADRIVQEALKQLDPQQLAALGIRPEEMISGDELRNTDPALAKPPRCERCHDLIYHSITTNSAKVPMFHPTVESLRETIEESPFKRNHIYHVIDAADFPMSLIPRLNVLLGDIPLRGRNRRSRSGKYQNDRQMEMSFIITRSDLLAPTEQMVNSLMPYLQTVLREALGRVGGRVRLGNVMLVSAKRGWWTDKLRDEIWERGGAGWIVGKVNVGKSQLFQAIFPRGRVGDVKNSTAVLTPGEAARPGELTAPAAVEEDEDVDLGDLLPPPQPATDYPEMPIVSSLPGTTASPIRVPFGKGRGELIDLPGLARGDLEMFVKDEYREDMVWKKRIVPVQASIKPGQSMLLGGGLIRITPRTPDLVFLAYNFTPLDEHVTGTEKAIEFQEQTRVRQVVPNISKPDIGDKMKLAGTFALRHDVTKQRAGPLTDPNAVGLKVKGLPFRVLSLDLLIEGVGYVELVAQVRSKDLERSLAANRAARKEQQWQEEDEEEEEKKKTAGEAYSDPFRSMLSQIRRDPSDKRARQSPPPKQKGKPEPEPEPVEPDWPLVDVFTPEGRFVGSRMPINGHKMNMKLVLPKHKKQRPRKSMKGAKKKAKAEKRAQANATGAT